MVFQEKVINSALSTLPSLGERDMHTKYDMMICCKKECKIQSLHGPVFLQPP
jgi:hypothetical protein